jgi:hypothetical protein
MEGVPEDYEGGPDPNDWSADPYVPNEQCDNCGLKIENYHYTCQGHQLCLPECPQCGGELVAIRTGSAEAQGGV